MATDGVISVLMIVAAPDDRPSTAALRMIVDELRARSDVRISVWFLRANPEQQVWPGALVIDSLRTWLPCRALTAVGLNVVADALRGLRLRWWNRRAGATVVVLDDGFGERVLTGRGNGQVLVVRRNSDLPDLAHVEQQPSRRPDLVLATTADVADGDASGRTVPRLVSALSLRDHSASMRFGDPSRREPFRRALDVPDDAPLVVGWGDDGWIDAPDVFVRALWALEHRQGIEAHGVWLGMRADPREAEQLRSEAERCGVAGRVHLRATDDLAGRCSGDVVFLPYRCAADPDTVLETIAAGVAVVTFLPCSVDDELVRLVPYLDVEAAAVELAAALGRHRAAVLGAVSGRVDVGCLVDRLLSEATAVRNR